MSNLPQVPFVSLPTDCSAGPQSMSLHADSGQEPGVYTEKTAVFPAVTGCNLLSFNAGTGIGVEPDTQTPDEPVGLGVNLKVPLNESPETNTTPAIRDTTVTLPEGMSVSPGVVDGIQACNATGPEGINITGPESEEISKLTGETVLAPGHCPDASIVGTAEAITPLLPTPVKGHIYLARPGCGGPGQARAPNRTSATATSTSSIWNWVVRASSRTRASSSRCRWKQRSTPHRAVDSCLQGTGAGPLQRSQDPPQRWSPRAPRKPHSLRRGDING